MPAIPFGSAMNRQLTFRMGQTPVQAYQKGLLERIDHLITKEEMMARIQPVGEKQALKASAKAH